MEQSAGADTHAVQGNLFEVRLSSNLWTTYAALQAEASKLLAELEELRGLSGDHAALAAENARLKGAAAVMV